MKTSIIRYGYTVVILLFCMTIIIPAFGQKKDRVRLKLLYTKEISGQRLITIGLTGGSGKNMHGVMNGTVVLSVVQSDSTVTLATLQTDTTGVVSLFLDDSFKLPVDENGICTLSSTYDGDDNYSGASGEMQIADIDIDFAFEERDSLKYISITAKTTDGAGNSVPVEGLDVIIGVQRLFSVLPIESVTTDVDGWAELEVPANIPGDSTGNLTFVAHFEEHELFGSVRVAADQVWGVPVSYEIKPLPRQLFTDEAPFWMISSVFIILIGAWYHFFLSVSKLVKLKNAGLKENMV